MKKIIKNLLTSLYNSMVESAHARARRAMHNRSWLS